MTVLVTSGSPSASSGRISTTGVSRVNFPSSTSCMTTVAVHTLLTEPICQTESSVAGWPVPAWRTPVTAVTSSSAAPSRPTRRMPSWAPGTPCFFTSSVRRDAQWAWSMGVVVVMSSP